MIKPQRTTLILDSIPLEISYSHKQGSGDLIFFIHGLGCSREAFLDAWEAPSLRGYSLLAPDLPGFGDSGRPAEFSYTLEDHARLCAALLTGFPRNRLHLACHSMGGAVAVLLAEMLPRPPESLISIEGNLIGADCGVSRRTVSVSYEHFRTRLLEEILRTAGRSPERGSQLWARWIRKADPLAFNQSARSLVDWSDSGMLLSKFLALKCRRVYFYGELQRFLPVLDRLGDIPSVAISGSGHFPMNDNPAEFYHKMAEWLKTP